MTPIVIGVILALIFAASIFGGSKQISKITGVLVPLMGIFYLAVSLFIVVTHFQLIPQMFTDIFTNAFDFRTIFGGVCRFLHHAGNQAGTRSPTRPAWDPLRTRPPARRFHIR